MPDLVEGEFHRGARVHHDGVMDVRAALLHQHCHRQFLDIDVGADQRAELKRACGKAGLPA